MGVGLRSASDGDDEQARLAELATRFPEAPAEELARFLGCRGAASVDDAAAAYGAHLEWRRGPGAPERLLQAARAVPQGFVRVGGAALDGSAVVLVQGARFDPAIASEEYVLACSQAMDMATPSGSEGSATILIDIRPGEGWPNPPATKLLPFFRALCKGLPANYPERMGRVIIFPVNSVFSYIWSLVSGLLDKSVKGSCVTLSGRAALGAPCPLELGRYVALEALPDDARARFAALAVEETLGGAPKGAAAY